MSYTVLYLTLLFMVTVESQSSSESPPTNVETIAVKEQTSKDGQSSSSAAPDIDLLKSSASLDKFSFTEADAKPKKQQLQTTEDNDPDDLSGDPDPSGIPDIAEELVIFETLLNNNEKTLKADTVTVTKTKDDDEDDDDEDDDFDGEDDDISSDTVKPLLISTPEEIQIRRQGDLNPDFTIKNEDSISYPQPRQDTNPPNSPAPVYIPERDKATSSDSATDSSPVLQLTQGGYQRPYQRRMRFNDQQQRMRSGSASQQSETVEAPAGTGNNGGQTVPQVTYTSAYQPQSGFDTRTVFRNPFAPPDAYINANGPMTNAVQNGFFNPPPAAFSDFATTNFPSQFAPSNDNGFSAISGDPRGFSLFQASPGHMLQSPVHPFQSIPQFIHPQPMAGDPQRPVHTLFQSGSFSNYPGHDNGEDASRPDYSAFFRNPSPVNTPQFQVNPNFYGTIPSVAGNGFNSPTINLLPNYPGTANGSPFSPRFLRYPMSNPQIPIQNTYQQVQKQQQDSEAGPDDQKTKDSDHINVSPNKEDPTSVPFGTRIQRQNDDPDQNDFVDQRDVYIRYPMREAGYATEENLPVQNTTDNNLKIIDTVQRPTFPFFTAPRQYPSFSSPDPYRNALAVLQQVYPSQNTSSRNDDNNTTQENIPEQFSRNIPFPFNQAQAQPPSPRFPGHSDGSADPTLLQSAQFYPAPGADRVGAPFNQIGDFPQNNYQFSAPTGSEAESNIIPLCAQESNASLCFKDTEYPRRELLYALNSDSFLLERLVMPDQQLEGISLVEQNTSESPESQDNYICKSDLKYGMPLRAKNIKGTWKVIVNIERAIGRGKFIQPVRLEVCRGSNEPCSFTTEIKTACVQKYSLQRLLSWSPEKGVHNDVYKLPVACSCQIVDAQV